MDELQKKVIDAVDEEFLVKTTMELVDIPSPTGSEEEAARYMHAKYEEAGFEAHLQKVAEGRYNAVGISPGAGGGYSLMFNGHLDTSYSGEEPELTQPGYKNKAIREGDWIYGNGAANMKSADVAYLGAAKALADAGVELKGDIVLASVVGEIEKNRIDQYQDVLYDGYGVGTRHLISHGYLTDFCILGEPTGMQVAPWHGGTMWFKIITQGLMGHTCYGDYTASAIERMERVQAAIRKWIPEYRSRNEFLGERPHVNVAAIEGGWPYRCARSPIECRLYVDVRLVPGQRVQDVEVEFKAMIAQVNEEQPDIGAKVEVFSSHPPSGIPVDSLAFQGDDPGARANHGGEAQHHREDFLSRRRPHEPLRHSDHHLRIGGPNGDGGLRLERRYRRAHPRRRAGGHDKNIRPRSAGSVHAGA